MEIIPAIDLIDGKCVRLSQGDYTQKTIYNENPVEVALSFEAIGLKRLHLVDLDGAKAGKVINYKVLEAIAKATNLTIDFGGGIKTDEEINKAFNLGAVMATIGSVAVKKPDLMLAWIEKYGADKILLGADVKAEMIVINGWASTTDVSIIDFIAKYHSLGINNIFCTDVSKDGMLQGAANELYSKLIHQFPNLNLIASGGVSTMADVYALQKIGCQGAIIGKAIYEEKISLTELKSFLNNS